MRGIVLYGINNIYTVETDNGTFECRFKGKKLKGAEDEYNPLASGDYVEIEIDEHHPGKAMIISRYPRSNSFARWNRKRNCIQTIAANIDLAVCILSPESPPFRPRFCDRVLVNCEQNIEVLIVLNKIDQFISEEVERWLEIWQSLGYRIHKCSTVTGEGLEELKDIISDRTSAFVGQSGVGKSSVLNCINPDFNFRTGEVSDKFNKGTHTTCYAVLDVWERGRIIDTPGIKEIDPVGMEPENLSHFLPEFVPFLNDCSHSQCLHDHEPGCRVKEAVKNGEISEERYDSYLRILENLKKRTEYNKYKKGK